MKKILLFVATTILFFGLHSTALFAQTPETDDGYVTFNADLQGAFQLYVNEGQDQTATFQSADDYNNGVSQTTGGIVPGYTNIAMDATGNWHLEIMAQQDFMPTGTATGSIPINNLGVWCQATGTHQFGSEVTTICPTEAQALGLSLANVMIIDLAVGNSNAGTPAENSFTLHWLMGTMQGSMRNESMFSQLASGAFSKGQFTTTIILTMTEIL